jgi:alkylhydroperoxidase family enzyme
MNQESSTPARPVSRIALVKPEDLTPPQLDAYNNSPSGKLNLALLLAHAKTMGPGFGLMLKAMVTDLSLPPIEREIVILAVLHLDRGEYEWAQHLQVADAMGIPKAKVEAIANERFGDPVFTDRERALLAFTRQNVRTVRVDDAIFNAVAAFYEPRQIVETIFVIGIYMMILRVSEVAELEIDAVQGADFWKRTQDSANKDSTTGQ